MHKIPGFFSSRLPATTEENGAYQTNKLVSTRGHPSNPAQA